MKVEKVGMSEALRQAAALIEAHPDLPAPYVTAGSWGYAEVDWYVQVGHRDHAEQKAAAAAVLRGIGGKWDKRPRTDGHFAYKQTWGGLRLTVTVEREAVCERIVTGTETVTVPAVEAKPEQTVEREVVEWRCQPLLADESVEVAS